MGEKFPDDQLPRNPLLFPGKHILTKISGSRRRNMSRRTFLKLFGLGIVAWKLAGEKLSKALESFGIEGYTFDDLAEILSEVPEVDFKDVLISKPLKLNLDVHTVANLIADKNGITGEVIESFLDLSQGSDVEENSETEIRLVQVGGRRHFIVRKWRGDYVFTFEDCAKILHDSFHLSNDLLIPVVGEESFLKKSDHLVVEVEKGSIIAPAGTTFGSNTLVVYQENCTPQQLFEYLLVESLNSYLIRKTILSDSISRNSPFYDPLSEDDLHKYEHLVRIDMISNIIASSTSETARVWFNRSPRELDKFLRRYSSYMWGTGENIYMGEEGFIEAYVNDDILTETRVKELAYPPWQITKLEEILRKAWESNHEN